MPCEEVAREMEAQVSASPTGPAETGGIDEEDPTADGLGQPAWSVEVEEGAEEPVEPGARSTEAVKSAGEGEVSDAGKDAPAAELQEAEGVGGGEEGSGRGDGPHRVAGMAPPDPRPHQQAHPDRGGAAPNGPYSYRHWRQEGQQHTQYLGRERPDNFPEADTRPPAPRPITTISPLVRQARNLAQRLQDALSAAPPRSQRAQRLRRALRHALKRGQRRLDAELK